MYENSAFGFVLALVLRELQPKAFLGRGYLPQIIEGDFEFVAAGSTHGDGWKNANPLRDPDIALWHTLA